MNYQLQKRVIALVTELCNISEEAIKSRSRRHVVVYARALISKVLTNHRIASSVIGSLIDRERSTVSNLVNSVYESFKEHMDQDIAYIEDRLNQDSDRPAPKLDE